MSSSVWSAGAASGQLLDEQQPAKPPARTLIAGSMSTPCASRRTIAAETSWIVPATMS
jgi:hypothetical protein